MKMVWPLLVLAHAAVHTTVDYNGLIHQKTCVAFVKENCPFSRGAISLLRDENVPCHSIVVNENEEAHRFSKRHHPTFPAVFLAGEVVKGGYQELQQRAALGLAPFQGRARVQDAEGNRILISTSLKE